MTAPKPTDQRTVELHDKLCEYFENGPGENWEPFERMSDHASELERELTAAQDEVARLTKERNDGEQAAQHWMLRAKAVFGNAAVEDLQRAEHERDNWQKLANERSAELIRVMGERDEALALSDRLRAMLGASNADCVYCTLPAAEQAKCVSGFPGCDRADDQMMCAGFSRSLSAEQKRDEARADAERLQGQLERQAARVGWLIDRYEDDLREWAGEGAFIKQEIDAALAREREEKNG